MMPDHIHLLLSIPPKYNISSLAQQERHMILQRQKEGIAAAHAKGKRFGRPEIEFPANF